MRRLRRRRGGGAAGPDGAGMVVAGPGPYEPGQGGGGPDGAGPPAAEEALLRGGGTRGGAEGWAGGRGCCSVIGGFLRGVRFGAARNGQGIHEHGGAPGGQDVDTGDEPAVGVEIHPLLAEVSAVASLLPAVRSSHDIGGVWGI